MQIRKRLQINVAVSAAMAVVIFLILFLTMRHVRIAVEASNAADEILKNAFERSTFREDYLRTGSERARIQWFSRHEQIGRLLRSAADTFTDPEDKKIIAEMTEDNESTGKIFSSIVENRKKNGADAASALLSRLVEERLETQLKMRLYDKILYANKLQESGRKYLLSALTQARWSIVCILASFMAAALVNTWTMSHGITNRVARLREGASLIGSGDLAYRIDMNGDDELAELADSFNGMTAKLRGSYNDLEKEIEGHKQTEEELQAANADLNDSRRAAINLMEDALADRRQAEEAGEALQKAHNELALRMEERTRELREKEVLLKEIHHRVKNNLQVISSLVGLQADSLADEQMREVFHDVRDRVRSMAMVHEKLYQSADLARIDFEEYTRSLLNYLWRAHSAVAPAVQLTFDLEPLSLPVDTAVPCGLILNELASNALKHAFRGRDAGEVIVSLKETPQGRISLSVRDNGVGMPEELDWRQARSLGLRLVQMLAGQMNATVELDRSGGTEFTLSFRLKAEG